MVRIPVEYQEVEYLESSGTQWINTGISLNVIADEQTTWHLKFSPTRIGTAQILCGANNSEKQVVLMPGGQIRKDWAVSERRLFSKKLLVGSIYLLSQINGYYELNYLDGEIESEQITKTTIGNYPFALFAKSTNSDGTTVENSTIAFMKLYSFKAFSDDSDICNFIPCYRKSDSEPGMYDTVTKQFFTNAGTGTFIVGNDVSWEAIDLLALRRRIMLGQGHATHQ